MKKIRIERVANKEIDEYVGNQYHATHANLYTEEWKELKRLFENHNPYVSTMPIRQVYRTADFNRLIMLLGMQRLKEMSEDELKEIGL